MLQRLDDIQVYNRTDGRYLCIFLDADNSRMDISFLQYTNEEGHQWGAWIDVLYGTHIWTVGYPKEQNEEWKWFTTGYKNTLLKIKCKLGMDSKLTKNYIIPRIVKHGYKASFAQADTDKRSIASCGLNF